MQRSLSLVRVLTVLGLALTVTSSAHHTQRSAAQAAGVTDITIVSLVADDPADPSFQAPYTYFVDAAGSLSGVTPAAAGSETYQAYDGDSGEILDTQPVGVDRTVVLVVPVGLNNHVINIDDPGDGSGVASGGSTVTVVVNPGTGTAPPAQPTATVPVIGTAVEPTTASADEPTAEPTDTPDGNSAAIYAGDCDADFTDDPVAKLTDVSAPDGEERGAASFAAVETSFTTLDLPLDDILADDHVLVDFDQADDTVPLACGAIGGPVSDDGSLAFGLPEAGDSGFSGVACLTEDDDQTQATIFLSEDRSGDATPAA